MSSLHCSRLLSEFCDINRFRSWLSEYLTPKLPPNKRPHFTVASCVEQQPSLASGLDFPHVLHIPASGCFQFASSFRKPSRLSYSYPLSLGVNPVPALCPPTSCGISEEESSLARLTHVLIIYFLHTSTHYTHSLLWHPIHPFTYIHHTPICITNQSH